MVEVRGRGEQLPEQRKPAWITPLFLEGKRSTAERDHLVRGVGLACVVAPLEGQRAREHRPGVVASGLGAFGDRFRRLDRRTQIEVSVCPRGLELERDVGPVRAYELGCASEQRGSGPVVLAVDRAVAGGREPGRGAVGEAASGCPSSRSVTAGLFEVVADDLVALDERVAVLVEPVGEAGMQVGADRLGERVVGGVANQQVAEAVAVVSGDLSTVGTDELAPHERGEPGRDLRLLGSERLHAAAVEDLALDRAALEHPALGLVELVEPGRQQRLQRRRHVDVPVLGGHREHLRDEERVAARSVGDPLAQLPRDGVPDQRVRVFHGERLEP